jgi:hypothetical protein
MADELNEETETEPTTEAEATEEPQERKFSQAEVDEIVKKVKRKVRRAKPKAQPEPPAEPESPSTVDDGSWRDDFYDAVMGHDLTRGQLRRMRTAFKNAKPDDPDAWVEEYCEDFGIGAGKTTETETKADEVAEVEPPSEPPASNKGSPQPIPDYDTITDPMRLSADDFGRMMQKYGEVEAENRLRAMVNRWAQNRRVMPPPKRG